jgi:hypothetical protein
LGGSKLNHGQISQSHAGLAIRTPFIPFFLSDHA